MLIEKNTVCYTSKIGHKGFWYPTRNKLLIKANCEVEKVSWIGGMTRIPIKVLKSCLIPLDITENTTTNISPPTKDQYTVVWIEKCLLN
tara:strand:- start:814 stop:1080 length:267 start_codon:yes stop_codon:yes gene_type:complete